MEKTVTPRSGLGGAGIAITLIAAVVVAIGSVGTWVVSDLAGLSIGGLEKDGPILIGLTLVAVVQTIVAATSGLKRPWWLVLSVVAAALCVLTGFIDLADVDSNDLGGAIEAGWGLKVAAYGSLGLLAGTVMTVIATLGARTPASESAA